MAKSFSRILTAPLPTIVLCLTAGFVSVGCQATKSVTATVTPPATQSATRPATQPGLAQRPMMLASPRVNTDGTVTFQTFAPAAMAVEIWGDWPVPSGGPMSRDERGVWSATLGPLPKGLWSYNFKVDGEYLPDRSNPNWKPSRQITTSVLELPNDAVWDRRPGVAHGVVHLHDYWSATLARTRRLRVYTPPDYDASAAKNYPVFYLLHGSGDDEKVWTDFGRANVILDNLIAAKAAVPMIVVMTDGHAAGGGGPADSRDKNVDAFSLELLDQVMPMIDALYRTRSGAAARAIAGLSMGGNQALIIGLHHPESFAWVGGMSSAIRNPERDLGDTLNVKAGEAVPKFSLVWLSCGVDDRFIGINRHIHDLLDQWHVPHEYAETPGKHAWPVWRNNLATLAPRLFQDGH